MLNNQQKLTVLQALLVMLLTSGCSRPSQPTPSAPPQATSTQPAVTATPPELPGNGARLIFHDEFNGTYLDTSIWNTQYRWGRTNTNEAQYYAPDAFEFRDGALRIKAERRQIDDQEYTSGVIASYDTFTFTYGYVEFRAKPPAGQGLWPALWMHLNDDDKTGEIDVMELLGRQSHTVHTTLHFPNSQGKSVDEGKAIEGPDFSKSFHIFAVDWSKNKVVWYVDGREVFQITHDIPDQPMYLLMNLAVGGVWPGYPDTSTSFPAYFDIDYVRVYQK